MNKFYSIIGVVLVGALAAGCASIIHGSRQDVRVLSNPTGAVVRVNLNNQATTTPGMLTLNRKEIGYALTFEKEGYKPVEVSLRRTIDGWLFGNILFGGLVGLVIDFASGSSYQLTPGEVSTVLVQMQQEASIQRGSGNDLFVFADLEQLPQEIQDRIAREDRAV